MPFRTGTIETDDLDTLPASCSPAQISLGFSPRDGVVPQGADPGVMLLVVRAERPFFLTREEKTRHMRADKYYSFKYLIVIILNAYSPFLENMDPLILRHTRIYASASLKLFKSF